MVHKSDAMGRGPSPGLKDYDEPDESMSGRHEDLGMSGSRGHLVKTPRHLAAARLGSRNGLPKLAGAPGTTMIPSWTGSRSATIMSILVP